MSSYDKYQQHDVFSSALSSNLVFFTHPSLSQVVPHVVDLVESLRTDGLPITKTFLHQFTELIHCMMYQYSGFPDLYDHILEAIKVNKSGIILIGISSNLSLMKHFLTMHCTCTCPLRICQNLGRRRSS